MSVNDVTFIFLIFPCCSLVTATMRLKQLESALSSVQREFPDPDVSLSESVGCPRLLLEGWQTFSHWDFVLADLFFFFSRTPKNAGYTGAVRNQSSFDRGGCFGSFGA